MDKSTIISNLELAAYNQDFDQLETVAKQAMQDFPEETFGYNYLVEALMEKEVVPYKAVELCLIKLIQLEENNLKAMVKLAEVKEAQGDSDAALSTYKAILQKDAMQPDALNAIGEYKLYIDRAPEDALSFFEMAVGVEPTDRSIVNKAIALVEMKKYAEALQIVRYVSTKGFDERTYVTEIQALEGLEQWKSAQPLYALLVAECPENAAYHYRFGELLMRLNRFGQAMMELERAIELFEPASDALLNKYYEVLMTTGSYESAANVADQLIERSAETLGYHLNKIKALAGQGKTADALTALDQFEQKVNADDYYQRQAKVERALILAQDKRFEEAEKLLKSMFDDKKARQHAFFALGKVKYQQDELGAAYYYLDMARKTGSLEAEPFVDRYFKEYLDITAKRVHEENATAQKEAAQQTYMKSIQNKLWAFKDMNSKKLESSVAEVRENVKKELQKRMMFFTDQGGFVLYPNGNVTSFAYTIETTHKENVLDLKLIPFDGLPARIVRLGDVKGKGVMLSEEEGEMLLFVDTPLNEEQKAHFDANVDLEALAILGDAVQNLK
jgi:Tfp pilus assembly protein PilF